MIARVIQTYVVNLIYQKVQKFWTDSDYLGKINNIRHFSNEINKRGGWISFCGGWNFSKLVSVDSTFIREMRVIKTLHGNSFEFHLTKCYPMH